MRIPAKNYYAPLVKWVNLTNLLTPKMDAGRAGLSQPERNVRELPAVEAEAAFARLRAAAAAHDKLTAPLAHALERAFPGLESPLAGWRAYDAIEGVRATLRALAWPPKDRDARQWDAGTERVSLPASLPLAVSVEGGKLIAVRDLSDCFLDALAGREANRIRICPVCEKLFVALRRDQSACRGRCTNSLNARRTRDRDRRKQYEANRVKNAKAKADRLAGRILRSK